MPLLIQSRNFHKFSSAKLEPSATADGSDLSFLFFSFFRFFNRLGFFIGV